MKTLSYPESFAEWRDQARSLLSAGTPPQEVLWQPGDQLGLFQEEAPDGLASTSFSVSRSFVELAKAVACHRSDKQWALLYSLLWRLNHGERHLLSIPTDKDVHPIRSMARHISRDIHKMHAFVRFRKVAENHGREQFVAWFEPDHRILPLASPFFRKRFTAMDWSILSPDACAHWDGQKLHFTEGVDKSTAAKSDTFEELWKTYYRSIFNPARLKVKAMQSEMPKKYWKNLPEAEIIEDLITTGSEVTESMLTAPATPTKPEPDNAYLKKLKSLG